MWKCFVICKVIQKCRAMLLLQSLMSSVSSSSSFKVCLMNVANYEGKAGWEEGIKQRQRKERSRERDRHNRKENGEGRQKTQAEGEGERERISCIRQLQRRSVFRLSYHCHHWLTSATGYLCFCL